MTDSGESVRPARHATVHVTPAIRRFYRRLRREGYTRDAAEAMTIGAVKFTGQGVVAFQWGAAGAEQDARGRAAGMRPVSDIRSAGDVAQGAATPSEPAPAEHIDGKSS